MLYSIKEEKLKVVSEDEFKLEKDIQKLVEKNINTLLDIEFVSSEFAINNFRFDTLAFNRESKAFVIIEYKKGKNESLIDQGYAYLNTLLDRKADLVLKYNEVFNVNYRVNDIEWEQTRVIFISPKFTEYQIKANDFKNNPIELIKVTKYENAMIEVDRLKKTSNIRSIITNDNADIVSKVDKEIKVYTEEDHLNATTDKIKELYNDIKESIIGWDLIDVEAKKFYMAFKGRTNIIDIVFKKKELLIFINLKKNELDDPKNIAVDMSETGHWGNGDYKIAISNDDDIEYVLSLIKQSWKKNKI